MNLIVADVAVRNDSEGRYHLNDLHKASGGKIKTNLLIGLITSKLKN